MYYDNSQSRYIYISFYILDESHSPSSPKSHHRTQSDDGTIMIQSEDMNDGKKESDKKTVKNILSQLLPSLPTLTSISVSI